MLLFTVTIYFQRTQYTCIKRASTRIRELITTERPTLRNPQIKFQIAFSAIPRVIILSLVLFVRLAPYNVVVL